MSDPATIRLHEWSTVGPDDPVQGRHLRSLRLDDERDRMLVEELRARGQLYVEALRSGWRLRSRSSVGTITLGGTRVVILPKIPIEHLVRLLAAAFDLSALTLTDAECQQAVEVGGLADLLGLALLQSTERIARGGLIQNYEPRVEVLGSPRGRIDMNWAARNPRRRRLRCAFDELTLDHALNQILAAGLRVASRLVVGRRLSMDLARAADRLLPNVTRRRLSLDEVMSTLVRLDRRSSHYRPVLSLIALLAQGCGLDQLDGSGSTSLPGFMVDMNRVFERFLERHLQRHAPPGVVVERQGDLSPAFAYRHNPHGWREMRPRVDLLFRRGNEVLCLGDAKYRDHGQQPPRSKEVYQLVVYGLSRAMTMPRRVLLFYPAKPDADVPTTVLDFRAGSTDQVSVILVGVPLTRILSGAEPDWWPAEIDPDARRQVLGKNDGFRRADAGT